MKAVEVSKDGIMINRKGINIIKLIVMTVSFIFLFTVISKIDFTDWGRHELFHYAVTIVLTVMMTFISYKTVDIIFPEKTKFTYISLIISTLFCFLRLKTQFFHTVEFNSYVYSMYGITILKYSLSFGISMAVYKFINKLKIKYNRKLVVL